MSVKKYFSLTIAGIATIAATSAVAGGPDVMAPPAPVVNTGFYVEAGAGYGFVDYGRFLNGIYTAFNLVQSGAVGAGGLTSNPKGGFIWGGDLGYNFNDHFAFELGAWRLRKVSGNEGNLNNGVVNNSNGQVDTQSSVIYAALKMTVPVQWVSNLEIFGKAGMGVRFLRYTGPGVGPTRPALRNGIQESITNHTYNTAVLGAGLQYSFTPEWLVSVQYLFVGGNSVGHASRSSTAPAAHLVTATVGYQFNI